eukprot:Rmarinus@m.11711
MGDHSGQEEAQIPANPPPQTVPADEKSETAIQDFLNVLIEHRDSCTKEGKYMEASIAQSRITELEQQLVHRRVESIKSKQIAERLGIEEAHIMTFQQFVRDWDEVMQKLREERELRVEELQRKHEQDFREEEARQMDSLKKWRPKYSKELLTLRGRQEQFASQRNFDKAHQMKQKADMLQNQEFKKLLKVQEEKMRRQLDLFRDRQSKEMAALQKRLESGEKQKKKERQDQLEILLQRYQNSKTELERRHNVEKRKLQAQTQQQAQRV